MGGSRMVAPPPSDGHASFVACYLRGRRSPPSHSPGPCSQSAESRPAPESMRMASRTSVSVPGDRHRLERVLHPGGQRRAQRLGGAECAPLAVAIPDDDAVSLDRDREHQPVAPQVLLGYRYPASRHAGRMPSALVRPQGHSTDQSALGGWVYGPIVRPKSYGKSGWPDPAPRGSCSTERGQV